VWDSIWSTAINLSIWEWLAFLFGLIYVLLAAKNHISCWIFGILSSSIWMGVSYFEYQLYMDSGLNFFYVIMGVIGWLNWGRSGGNPVISANTVQFHLIAIFILLALSAVIGQLLQTYTQAALPFWDAGTTLFSILATYLLVKHKKENWLYWIVTNGIYVGLYMYKGAYLFAILFVIYTVLSVKGWRDWSKETAYIE